MKNIILIVSLFLLTGIAFNSCSDDSYSFEEEFAVSINLFEPTVPNVIINSDYPDAEAFHLTWSDMVGAGAPYTVEAARDEVFSEVVIAGVVETNDISWTMQEVNQLIGALGANPYEGTPLFIRVRGANGDYSNNITLNVTGFPVEVPELTEPSNGSAFTLDVSMIDVVVTTVKWLDFDNSTSGVTVDYVVEAAASGTDFAAPVTAGTVSSTSLEMNMLPLTHGELNDVALACGLMAEEAGSIDMRIKASIETASNSEIVRYSEPITITVTPFNVEYPNLYLVGSATAAGWDPNNNNPIVYRSADNPTEFHYSGYFNQGEFKMLEVLGSWQPQWGTNDGSTLAVNDGTSSDPGTFMVAEAGYYDYTFNLAGTTGTFSAVANSTAVDAPTYGSIGIIGSATAGGWDTDTNLVQSSFDPHQWSVTGVPLSAGEYKFRADDDWANNWGAGVQELFGVGVPNGGNNVLADTGSYDIYFNDLDGSFVLVQN